MFSCQLKFSILGKDLKKKPVQSTDFKVNVNFANRGRSSILNHSHQILSNRCRISLSIYLVCKLYQHYLRDLVLFDSDGLANPTPPVSEIFHYNANHLVLILTTLSFESLPSSRQFPQAFSRTSPNPTPHLQTILFSLTLNPPPFRTLLSPRKRSPIPVTMGPHRGINGVRSVQITLRFRFPSWGDKPILPSSMQSYDRAPILVA